MQRDLDLPRWMIAAIPPVAALLFWRATNDVFGVTKATLVGVAVVTLVVGYVATGLRDGLLRFRTHPALWAAAAVVLLAGVATVTSDAPTASLMGRVGRHSGLVMYTVYAGLFALTVTVFTAERARWILGGLIVATAGVAGYALVQWVGADPFLWGEIAGQTVISSTVGNPNYVAAHLAIGLPAALWGAANRRWSAWARGVAGLVALLAVAAIFPTQADQGPIAAAAGLAIFLVALSRTRSGSVRHIGPIGVGLVGILGAATVLLGVYGIGPLDRFEGKWSTELRGYQWASASAMVADRPLSGVGFDRFGSHHPAYRSPEAAAALRVGVVDPAPHNVPLNMFVSGGVPLGVAYLAFVGIVGWLLLAGLVRSEEERLLLLGGLGGAWAAYQAQGLVSVDIPSLAVTHWILAAGIVVVAGSPRLHQVRLPWAAAPRGKRRKVKRQSPPAWAWIAIVLVVVSGLFAAVQLSRPLRADLAAREAATTQDPQTRIEAAERAAVLAPWEPRYHVSLGRVYGRAGRVDEAFATFEAAMERDPRNLQAALAAASLVELTGDIAEAERWYRIAVALEPHHADVLVPAAEILRERGAADEADALLEAAVEPRSRGGGSGG